MIVRIRLLAAVALTAVTLLATAPSSWAQSDPPSADTPAPGEEIVNSWSLAPTGSGDPSLPGNRPNLIYDAAPGSTIEDSVTLANFSNVALTFRLYSTDAFNNDAGEFAVLEGDEAPDDVGSWVTLPQEYVILPPNTQVDIPITLTVPADATPGDHVGAVLASSEAEGTGPDGKTVTVDRRTGTRIYLRVTGPLSPELAVEDLQTRYTASLNPLSGSAEVTYRVRNRGNVRLGGTQQLSVGGPFGIAITTLDAEEIPELLPGESYEVTRTVGGVPATVALVTDVDLQPEAVGAGADDLPQLGGSALSLAVPVTIMALLLVVALVWCARRAYLRRNKEIGPPPPSQPPAARVPVGQAS